MGWWSRPQTVDWRIGRNSIETRRRSRRIVGRLNGARGTAACFTIAHTKIDVENQRALDISCETAVSRRPRGHA